MSESHSILTMKQLAFFHARVDTSGIVSMDRHEFGTCWVWTGKKTRQGFGQMTCDGQTFSAHRFAWILENGESPGNRTVLHHCPNRLCVRPSHLFLGHGGINETHITGDVVELILNHNYVATVDLTDLAVVTTHYWTAMAIPVRIGLVYAHTSDYLPDGRKTTLSLHRFLMRLERGDGQTVDHIDGNGLNCRRSNMRLVTASQNSRNKRKRKTLTSQFKGVAWCASKGCFQATIQVDGKNRHLGFFPTTEEAARAYNAAALRHYGEFACLNIIS